MLACIFGFLSEPPLSLHPQCNPCARANNPDAPLAHPAILVTEYILKNLCLVPFSFDWISYTHMVNFSAAPLHGFKRVDIISKGRHKKKRLKYTFECSLRLGLRTSSFFSVHPLPSLTQRGRRSGDGMEISPTRIFARPYSQRESSARN